MTKDEFDASLRQFRHRRPFVPFAIELQDGRNLVIRKPEFVFEDGAASFIDPEDGALVDFFHEEVRSMGLVQQEEAST
jgi:hypothetical protein